MRLAAKERWMLWQFFHLWIYATFKPKTAYLWGNTTSYELYKWIKAVTKL